MTTETKSPTAVSGADPASPLSPLAPRPRHRTSSFDTFASASTKAQHGDANLPQVREHPDEEASDGDLSLWKRAILNPLLAISFILSLTTVTERDARRRASSRRAQGTAPRTFWSTFTLWNWSDPEPYQDPRDTSWGTAEGAEVPDAQRKKWFIGKKHRKVSRMWLDEAMEMRGTMFVVLVAAGCVVFAGVGWIASKLWDSVRR